MILAFDTSSALTSVAVVDGQRVVAEAAHLDARRHAEVLAPLLADVLAGIDRASIETIACGVGPGPYTGLRVGIATALAVGIAWQVPVHGICSLDAVAAAALDLEPAAAGVCVALDARRREVYWARYSADGRRREGPRVAAPATIDQDWRSGTWAGNGAAIHADVFGSLIAAASDEASGASYPLAAWIGRRASALLAEGVRESRAEVPLDAHGDDSGASAHALGGATLLPPRPLYLRRPDAVVARA
jgi:tRNA threonylcarbamoyl adenosine modification protein YeaZ